MAIKRNSRITGVKINTGSGARSAIQHRSTFVNPQRVEETSGLGLLAGALKIGGAAADRKKELQDAADIERGKLEGLMLSAKGDPAKIKLGEMFPQASPAFMMGLRESQSKAWAYRQADEWKAEYNSWEGKNSNNPNDFHNWLGTKLGDARSALGDDQFAIGGAMPVLQQTLNNMSAAHTSYTAKRVMGEETQAMREVVQGIVKNREGTDTVALFSQIDHEVGLRVRKGMDGTVAKQTIFDDLLAQADAYNDGELLAQLDEANANGIFKLNPTQEKLLEDAQHDLDREIAAEATAQAAADKKARIQAEEAALGAYTATLGVDGAYELPPEDLKRQRPKLYKSMLEMRKAVLSAKDYVDPVAEQNSMGLIWGEVYSDKVKKMSAVERVAHMSAFIANNPNVALSEGTMGSIMRELGDTKSAAKTALQNPTVKGLHTPTLKLVKSYFDKPADMFGEGGNNLLSAKFEGMLSQALASQSLDGMDMAAASATYNSVAKNVLTHMFTSEPEMFETLAADFAEGKSPPIGPVADAFYEHSNVLQQRKQAEDQAKAAADAAAQAELAAIIAAEGGPAPTGDDAAVPSTSAIPSRDDLEQLSNEDLANAIQDLINQSR